MREVVSAGETAELFLGPLLSTGRKGWRTRKYVQLEFFPPCFATASGLARER